MQNFFETHDIFIGEKSETEFRQANNTYQDGTTPLYRDVNGKLWGMSGHSHLGTMAMFCGSCVDDMKKLYDIEMNFCTGHADYAFNGIRYPEGVAARGSVWPFGLYICPGTHRFFCLFHNESGWCGRGTAYDSYGLCETPKGDSDFRHVGLMHSDNEGKTWTFDRWVLTAEKPCFTQRYNPGAGQVHGQPYGVISLGSGDFTLYVEPDGDFMYLFYNIIEFDMERADWNGCHVYVARSRKRTDGFFGDFVKYYDRSFCESGIMGRETPIVRNAWHARMAYSEKYHLYFLSSTRVTTGQKKSGFVDDVMDVRTSTDRVNWSEPYAVLKNGAPFGNHYLAMVSPKAEGQPNILSDDEFAILANHNGTDVIRYQAAFVEKNGAHHGFRQPIGTT